ncbi:MAG: alpha/beta hydrolase [Acidimicrobiales bacterium]
MGDVHPDLLPLARLIPRVSVTPRTLRAIRWATDRIGVPDLPRLDDVVVEDRWTPASDDGHQVRVRWYRPADADQPIPALLWLHGGGYVMGMPEQDQHLLLSIVRELRVGVAAPDYRLAPEHPHPAPVHDGHAALRWLHAQADGLGVDPSRIAVGGASAGGGLAAAVTLLAHDRADAPVAFQLLVYPMLDDRTVVRTDHDPSDVRVWTPRSNAFAWRSLLGAEPGGPDVDPYAAPARREDLAGLAPAWIGVGTHDLFHDEDVAYARRLADAGVPCQLEVVPGAYHGFDNVSRTAAVVRAFRQSYVDALAAALATC